MINDDVLGIAGRHIALCAPEDHDGVYRINGYDPRTHLSPKFLASTVRKRSLRRHYETTHAVNERVSFLLERRR